MKTAAEIADNILQNILIYACNDTAYEGDLNFVSKALTDYAEARVKETHNSSSGQCDICLSAMVIARNAALDEATKILAVNAKSFPQWKQMLLGIANRILALKIPSAEEKKMKDTQCPQCDYESSMIACCEIKCQKQAEWEIVSGPTTDDYTHACTRHIGILLSDAKEHRIHRIA